MPGPLRRPRNPRSAPRASATQFARAARDHRARHDGAGLGQASRRRRSEMPSPRARRSRSCRCCASPTSAALQKESPPFGGFNVTPPGKARRLLMSPGPIFEPEGDGADWCGAARALFCRGLPRRRHRAQFLLLSSDARRLHPGVRRARARLRRHPRRRRQHRAAARGDRALQAGRLCRHAGFPEDPARHRGEGRQGRLLDQARAGLRRGAAGLAARRSSASAASPCCSATPSPSSA